MTSLSQRGCIQGALLALEAADDAAAQAAEESPKGNPPADDPPFQKFPFEYQIITRSFL